MSPSIAGMMLTGTPVSRGLFVVFVSAGAADAALSPLVPPHA
jgi:hypothetical protein